MRFSVWNSILSAGILFSLVPATARGITDTRVRMVHGCPRLFISGKLTPPLILFVNISPNDPKNAEQTGAEIRYAASQDIHIISFQIPVLMADPPTNYHNVDSWLAFVLQNDPNAYIIPRVWCGGVAFDQQHPSQMIDYSNGAHPMASVASNLWYHDAKLGLIALIHHIRASRFADHVIGYHLTYGNTGEWFTPDYWDRPGFDYSEPNRLGFSSYLKSRYLTDASLRAAWSDPAASFQNVAIPPATPDNRYPFYTPDERRYVDYLNYQSDITAERIEGLAKVVKRETGDQSLVIVFYGYGFECPMNDNSHRALGHLLRCPNIDAFASPVSYGDRKPGGSSPFMGPVDSAALHGKLWILEDDTRTFVQAEQEAPEEKNDPASASRCANLEQTVAVHRRNFGQMMIHRLGTWWMDLFGLGWLNNADIWNNIGELRSACLKFAPQNQFKPDVAVIYDERSPSYERSQRAEPLLVSLLAEPVPFYRCGASLGFYLLSDLKRPNFPPAKVLIFLNAWHVDAAVRKFIREKLERDGRTLIWMYGDGFIKDGKISADAASRLIGLRLRLRAPAARFGSEIVAGNALGLPIMHITGLDASDIPTFAVDDRAAIPLARYQGTGEVSIALRKYKGFQSLFIGETRPPAAFWRALLPHLGAPVYLDTDDAFETDGSLMMISSNAPGERTISLPVRSSVYDLMTGQKLASNTRHCQALFGMYETKLLRIVPASRKALAKR